MSARFICSSCSWYTWISASSVQTFVGRSAVVWRNSSKKAARILFVFTSSKSWVLTNLWVSQHATFINLHLILQNQALLLLFLLLQPYERFHRFIHRLCPWWFSYLMASIEMPGLMMKAAPCWSTGFTKLGSKRVAVGAAFLHQVCPSDPQKIVRFQVPSPLVLRLSKEEKKPALAPNGFTTVLELIGVSKTFPA